MLDLYTLLYSGSYCQGQAFNQQKKMMDIQPLNYDRLYQNQLPMQWIKPAAEYLREETKASPNGYFQSGRIDQGTQWKQTHQISGTSKVTKLCMCSCTSGIPQCTCDVKYSAR